MTTRTRSERGAAAIEFALVLPLLLLIVAGITDFGRAFYTQIVMTNGAREGVRLVAMGFPESDAQVRVNEATGDRGTASYASPPCPDTSGPDVVVKLRVTPTEPFTWIFLDDVMSLFPGAPLGAAPTLDALGAMRCGG